MVLRIVIGVLFGAGLGGIVGYMGRCAGGTCPFVCNPVGGILFGGVVGALVMLTVGGGGAKAFTPSEHLIEVTQAEDFDRILVGGGIVLVDFYADWCGPCRKLKPTMHVLADEYAGRVKVVAVNFDKAADLVGRYAVKSIPDVRMFAGGNAVAQVSGYRSADVYRKLLDDALASPAQ